MMISPQLHAHTKAHLDRMRRAGCPPCTTLYDFVDKLLEDSAVPVNITHNSRPHSESKIDTLSDAATAGHIHVVVVSPSR